MASGTVVGGETENNRDGEKQKFIGHKVYTRKAFKGSKKSSISTAVTTANSTTGGNITNANTSAIGTDDKDINRSITVPAATITTTNGHNECSGGKGVIFSTTSPAATTATAYTTTAIENNSDGNNSQDKELNPTTTTTTDIKERDANLTTSSAPAAPTSTTSVNDQDILLAATSVSEAIVATTSNGGCGIKNSDSGNKEIGDVNLTATPATTIPFDNATISNSCKTALTASTILPTNPTTSSGKKDDYEENHQTQQQGPQASVLEDTYSTRRPQPPTYSYVDAPAVSDDSSSLNRQQGVDVPGIRNGADNQGLEDRVKINLRSKSKQEVREIRRKLEGDLHTVRSLVRKIEAEQGKLRVMSLDNSQVVANNGVVGGLKRVNSGVTSVGVPRQVTSTVSTPTARQSRPLNQLSVSLIENSQGMGEVVEKEKRTPKANQFYRNSEFLLANDKFPPSESNKKSKLNGKKQGAGDSGVFGSGTKIYKQCSAILDKLLKHKHAWVFDAPVDVAGLGLHDYYTIIKHPMDLGTVKSNLQKNWYKSCEEFAEDVRLTFHNAMRYNPRGQDVYVMAEELLEIFEQKWATIKLEHDREMRLAIYKKAPTPTARKAPPLPPPLDMRKILHRSESMTFPLVDTRPRAISTTPGRTPVPKKPKAKDPHKRDMTYEEKQKLSTNLQSLPSEKLDNIVQIIKRRNSTFFQHDDEIEVDIDSVDTETLWELDRFVTNYKKSLSKNKRKAELAIQARAEAEQHAQKKVPAPVAKGAPEATTTEEKNVYSSSPVPVEKGGENGSRSSSSISSSSDSGSSSSDSDSDSSSASGSDVGH